jgi:hypothetical protein
MMKGRSTRSAAPSALYRITLKLRDIFEYSPGGGLDRQVRIHAVVAARWGDTGVCHRRYPRTSVVGGQNTSVEPGDEVDAVGFPVLGDGRDGSHCRDSSKRARRRTHTHHRSYRRCHVRRPGALPRRRHGRILEQTYQSSGPRQRNRSSTDRPRPGARPSAVGLVRRTSGV